MSDINLLLTIIAVFAAIALLVGSLLWMVLDSRSLERRRVQALLQPRRAQVRDDRATLSDVGNAAALKKLATFLPKSPKDMSRLQRRMATAGFHGVKPVVIYAIAEVGLAVVCGLAIINVFGFARGWIFALVGAILGYVTPSFYVERRIALRKKQIENGLPDALDLLIVCLEAGLGIDQAIVKSADELAIAYPPLSDELRMVNVECRAGKSRIEAFKNFSARTKVEDVRSLVSMLVQTDRFGTSIAQALRTHAEVSRTKRRQRAEERAAKIGVKLVFPLVFCLFPAFYVVTLGPAVIKFVEAFSTGNLGGQP